MLTFISRKPQEHFPQSFRKAFASEAFEQQFDPLISATRCFIQIHEHFHDFSMVNTEAAVYATGSDFNLCIEDFYYILRMIASDANNAQTNIAAHIAQTDSKFKNTATKSYKTLRSMLATFSSRCLSHCSRKPSVIKLPSLWRCF